MSGRSGPHADYVPGLVDPYVLKAELLEQPLQLLTPGVLVEGWSGDLANTDLFVNVMCLVVFGSVQRDFHGWLLRQFPDILRSGQGQRSEAQRHQPRPGARSI